MHGHSNYTKNPQKRGLTPNSAPSFSSRFFSYTELRTKVTSLTAFALCVSYFFLRGWPLSPYPCVIFFFGMFCFDLCTTAINNYLDSLPHPQRAEIHTVLPFSRPTAFKLLLALLLSSVALGIWLVILSDFFVFLIGGLCFLCGIFYTFGPLPISRLPFGEVLSGAFYGFFIPLIFFYLNLPSSRFINFSLQERVFSITMDWPNLLALILLAVTPFCCTANIMLANNICDLNRDLAETRRTLPGYIGTKWSLRLFAALYCFPYFAVILLVLFRFVPIYLLLFLATAPFLYRNVRIFFHRQEKAVTFKLAVHNHWLLMLAQIALMLLSLALPK